MSEENTPNSEAAPETPPAADVPAGDVPASPPPQNTEGDWRASLPEDIRNDPNLRDIQDVTGLAKSLVHAQKLIGMDRDKIVTIPSEDADEGTMEEFYTKLGRPAEAKDYSLPVDEVKFPEGNERSEEMENWYKGVAHKHGLSAKQAAGVYKDYMEWASGSFEQGTIQLEQMREQVQADLKKEWGAAYDTKFKQSVSFFKNHADEEFVEFLNSTGLGSHPAMIKLGQAAYVKMGEDSLSDPSKTEVVMSPGEAQAELARKFADKNFMEIYRDGKHPSHKWAVEEMSKLYQFQTAGS